MDKEKRKFLKRRLAWISLRLFISLQGVCPLRWSYFLGNIIGSLGYLLASRHRRIAWENLALAFSGFSLRDRIKIAYDSFIFMAQSLLELLYFSKNTDELRNIYIEGRENLKKALSEGRGVIVLTAHLGNFPLMSLKLTKEGYPVNIVVRPMRDGRVNSYIHNLRMRAGIKTIFSYPRKACVSGIIKALRENELVLIQMDQNFGTGGVWVKFFGRLAATPVGPVVFALRTKAAVCPAYIFRRAKGKHHIKIFPSQQLVLKEDKNYTILLNTIKFTRIIESWVKDFPSQWSWIHRRWKSRPSEKIKEIKFKMEE